MYESTYVVYSGYEAGIGVYGEAAGAAENDSGVKACYSGGYEVSDCGSRVYGYEDGCGDAVAGGAEDVVVCAGSGAPCCDAEAE